MSRSQGRAAQVVCTNWDEVSEVLSAGLKAIQDNLPDPLVTLTPTHDNRPQRTPNGSRDAFYIILPMLIVLSTFLFLLLLFLICVILLRRRRRIMLRDSDGPIDMSREDLIEGEGGFEGVESRWLETASEPERRAYQRGKGQSPTVLTRASVRLYSPHLFQSIRYSTHLTLCRQISPSLSSSPSKRRVYQHGRLNPISRLYRLSWYTLARSSHSFPILHRHPLCSRIFRSLSSTRFTIGRPRCSTSPRRPTLPSA